MADAKQAQQAKQADETRGTCDTCGRERRVYVLGTTVDLRFAEDVPVLRCGTCLHRQERRTNTRSMYGRGRRGY